MSSVSLIVSIVILLIAVVLFLKRPKSAGGISEEEMLQLKKDNEQLKITLAIADEKLNGLISEKESVTALLREEKEMILSRSVKN